MDIGLLQALARAHRAAADSFDQSIEAARAELRDWVDQNTSQLGRRRHIAAVRKRLAAGDTGAAFVGRRALLSAEAHRAELAALSQKPEKAAQSAETPSGPEALRARLGLVVGGAR